VYILWVGALNSTRSLTLRALTQCGHEETVFKTDWFCLY